MASGGRDLLWSLAPHVALTVAAGGFAVWLAPPETAIWTVGGMLLTASVQALQVRKHRQRALAQLRNPELRGSSRQCVGAFEPILEEMASRLDQQEADLRLVQQSQAEVETRNHIRHKYAQRLEAVLQSLAEPVFVFDSGQRLVFSNAAATALARHAGGLEGESLPEISALLDTSRWKGASQKSRSVEFTRTSGNGKKTWRATASVLMDDGVPTGMMVVVRDISHDSEQKSRHAEFVSSVCHELKTPMASIKAFVEMLMDGETADKDEELRLLGFIDLQVDRLTRLVHNMLNLARIESGVIQVKRENTALNDILRKTLDVVRPMADEKSITLSTELSELYIGVHVDRDLMAQAVINLLSNAIKYTPRGGHVWLRSRQEDGEALIEVRDDGMGIPEEDQRRIFQRFFRVERNNEAAPGTGLGLALVQYIIRDIHNGRVLLRSRVCEGSCFTIALPLGHRGAPRRPVGTVTWMM